MTKTINIKFIILFRKEWQIMKYFSSLYTQLSVHDPYIKISLFKLHMFTALVHYGHII